MSPANPKIEPERLTERLGGLPGIERVREAAAGFPAYLVGGGVRDLLMGRDRADVDVAVEGDVTELAKRLGGEVLPHPRFATATVRTPDLIVDLAATRAERYPRPGALPEISPASLAEDLARRDFTVNAMAVPLEGPARLIDPHGGVADLKQGRLRVLHPASFSDDPTRALRAARYAARYGFGLDPETAARLDQVDLSTVSADRVNAELRRLAAEPQAPRGFALIAEWGLLELAPNAIAVIEAARRTVARPPWPDVAGPAETVLAAALGPGQEGARELVLAKPSRPSQGAAIARGRAGVELALARALGADWLDDYVSEWRHVRLEIDGTDLLDRGVAEGPGVGRGLARALAAKLDGEVSGREEELETALAAARDEPAV